MAIYSPELKEKMVRKMMSPASVSINPITAADEGQAPAGAVNFPTFMAVGVNTKCTLSENQLSKTA